MLVIYKIIYYLLLLLDVCSCVRAEKIGRGGKDLHRINEVNDLQTSSNSFPFVLYFGMNNVNNVNNALKSRTYNVNKVRTTSEQSEQRL